MLDFEETISSAISRDASPSIFERAIIGCLLECSPSATSQIASQCESEIFGSHNNQFIYNILRNAAFSKTPLGKETAAATIQQAAGSLEYFSNLEAVKEYLDECCQASQPFNSWPEYVKQIHLAHTRRKLLAAFDDATISALSADNAENATADAIYKVIEAAGELRRNAIKDESKIENIVDRYLHRYVNNEAVAFTYPQEKLNTAGGARQGQVIIFAGGTGLGKSWWTIDTVLHAVKNHKKTARIYTLEMDENDILDRMLAMENRWNLDDIILQKVSASNIADSLQEIADLPISIIDRRISPGRIIADIAGMGDDRPDIVVVDHLDLFNWREGNEVNALKGALANFKDAAKQYGVTFILVSQFRRPRNDDEDKYPHIGMLKGGSAIEQIADMIIFLTEELYRGSNGDEKIRYISVRKMRQGKPASKFKVNFTKDYRFR